ncbi:hypothetical protein OROHE_007212 [Orobanche hederae]
MPPFERSRPRFNSIHHDSNSNFSKLSTSDHTIPFIDKLFSILLSLLRTGNLPSKAKSFDIQDLIFESQFYGIESLLINTQSNPTQFEAFNLEKSLILPLSGRDSPSTVSTTAKSHHSIGRCSGNPQF